MLHPMSFPAVRGCESTAQTDVTAAGFYMVQSNSRARDFFERWAALASIYKGSEVSTLLTYVRILVP